MNLTQTVSTSTARANVVMQAIFAVMIGGLVVFAAGLANSDALHDAAHDVRHSTGFPCH